MFNPKVNNPFQGNIWVISNDQEFDELVMNGGWVILVTESPSPSIVNHPKVLGGSILLPPYESIAAKINGDEMTASNIYINHLECMGGLKFVNIILKCCISGIPLGLYFGPDEVEMGIQAMFVTYMGANFGINIGCKSMGIPSWIDINMIPRVLDSLYCNGDISYEEYMINHPLLPMYYTSVNRMIADVNPYIPITNRPLVFDDYYQHFWNILVAMKTNNNRLLIDPLTNY